MRDFGTSPRGLRGRPKKSLSATSCLPNPDPAIRVPPENAEYVGDLLLAASLSFLDFMASCPSLFRFDLSVSNSARSCSTSSFCRSFSFFDFVKRSSSFCFSKSNLYCWLTYARSFDSVLALDPSVRIVFAREVSLLAVVL